MNSEETKQDELILIKNVGYFHPDLLGIKMGDTGESVAEDNNVPVKRPDTMISLEWVKTTDRLPTKEDEGVYGTVLGFNPILLDGEYGACCCVTAQMVIDYPDWWIKWMPIPPLPEVADADA